MKQSWECHKCHAVNAPHLDQCPCSAVDFTPNPGIVQPFIVPTPIITPTVPYWPLYPGTGTITCGQTGTDLNRPFTAWNDANGGVGGGGGNINISLTSGAIQ